MQESPEQILPAIQLHRNREEKEEEQSNSDNKNKQQHQIKGNPTIEWSFLLRQNHSVIVVPAFGAQYFHFTITRSYLPVTAEIISLVSAERKCTYDDLFYNPKMTLARLHRSGQLKEEAIQELWLLKMTHQQFLMGYQQMGEKREQTKNRFKNAIQKRS